jgi:predicted TIM-barrel fold metal-dependent hydrolase
MWREQAQRERNRAIWTAELAAFVPDRVLDVHVHIFHEASIPPTQEPFPAGGWPLTKYDYDDLRQDWAETLPGRDVRAVCFGIPLAGYNHAENNRYVAEGADGRSLRALRLVSPTEDPAGVERDVKERGFVGFKPYPDLVGKADVSDVTIHEMLPGALMEVADDRGLVIMLHIPRRQRLADPINQQQIVELCRAWPNARIILAHIGRAYYLRNVVGHLDALKGLPNLYFDLAMVNHWEVIEHLLATVPPDRVLYGSDIPIALAPGKSVEINDQYTYVTPVPWSLSIHDPHGRLVFTSFLYEELRAIRKAVERARRDDAFVEQLFYGNAAALLDSVSK